MANSNFSNSSVGGFIGGALVLVGVAFLIGWGIKKGQKVAA